MQKIWWLEIEDCSGAFSSYEKALAYLMEVTEGWKNLGKEECPDEGWAIFSFETPIGNIVQYWIAEYEVDNPHN